MKCVTRPEVGSLTTEHNLYPLWIFLQIVQRGSLAGAAREFGLSPPAVSGQLKQLESRYGRLLDRGRQGVRVTERGQQMSDAARRIFAELAVLGQDAYSEALAGQVSLGASTFPAAFLLPSCLAKFQALHPGVDLSLVVGASLQAELKVLNGDLGLAVVGGIPCRALPASLEVCPFAIDQLAFFAAPQLARKLAASPWPGTLNQTRLLWRERGSSTRAVAEGWAQPWLTAFGGVREIGNSEALREWVLAGSGVAVLSERAVERERSVNLIARLDAAGPARARHFHLIRRRDHTASRVEAALWQFLCPVHQR